MSEASDQETHFVDPDKEARKYHFDLSRVMVVEEVAKNRRRRAAEWFASGEDEEARWWEAEAERLEAEAQQQRREVEERFRQINRQLERRDSDVSASACLTGPNQQQESRMPEDYYVRTSLDFGTEVPVPVKHYLKAMAEEVDADTGSGLPWRWERVPGSVAEPDEAEGYDSFQIRIECGDVPDRGDFFDLLRQLGQLAESGAAVEWAWDRGGEVQEPIFIGPSDEAIAEAIDGYYEDKRRVAYERHGLNSRAAEHEAAPHGRP